MILHHQFVRTAKRQGDKLAIADRMLEKRVPYSKALIGSLILSKKIGKFKEGYIGIMIPTSAGSFLATIGTLMAGKVPVMINYSTGAADNCVYAQNKCGFKTIITSRALLEKIGCRLVPGMICLEDIMDRITAADKLKAALKSKLPTSMIIRSFPLAHPNDNVVILFTSGSEKDPKAVQLTHRNITSNIADVKEIYGLGEKDVIMSCLPLFHVFGYTVDFWLPMTIGMTAVTYANPLDYKRMPILIREEKVTMIAATPIFFSGYVRESKTGDFATVRLMVAGADKTPDSLREEYMKKHHLELLEGYGCTETSPVVSVNRPGANRPGSIGLVIPSAQVRIADMTTGQELPPGSEGKILVKGNCVMKGYYDDIEETSLRIKDGWYDTGDMGMMDKDGYLWHRGRLKRFVKIGGEMVSLVKTESVLEELLPEGVDCCVVEVPDSLKGARIVVVITREVDEREILKKMGQKLTPIALPKQFIVVAELPKLGSGKIDFRSATELAKTKVTAK
jgi:acyl-[acyl-carrier-protein]-phospholipid O-acyltransferase/long-chain-fatty-acid--[acyl-carrier-protein] ligase